MTLTALTIGRTGPSASAGWQSALFALSAVGGYAGFYVPGVPVALALLPLVICALSEHRWERTIHAAIFHALVFYTSGWGLLQISDSWLATLAYALFLAVPTVLFGMFNVGAVVAVLALLPWHPAQPGIFAGDLGLGGSSIPALCFLLAVLDLKGGWTTRIALFVGIALLVILTNLRPVPVIDGASTLSLEGTPAISVERGLRLAAARPPVGGTIIFGENVIDARGRFGWRDEWCRTAEALDVEIIAGVQLDDLVSQIWRFPRTDCEAELLYDRRVGLPMVSSGWGLGQGATTSAAGTTWMICFEAFSPWRWLEVTWFERGPIFIASNDVWLKPTPIDVLREKVSISWARTLGRPVAFATGLDEAVVLRGLN